MKVVTSSEMQAIDRITIQELGIPGDVLMGMAGRSVAETIRYECPRMKKAAVFAGTGNNGGDGFVISYFLTQYGTQTDVFLVGDESKISDTSRVYFNLCKKSGIPIGSVRSGLELDDYDCVIDAILGTGFAGAVRGEAAEVIRMINDSDSFVVSVDIPSGLGSDGAAPESEAVMADLTVTIGLPKISLVTYPGKEYAGTMRVVDIGFPRKLTESEDLKTELIDGGFFSKHGIREIESEYCSGPDSHKGARGHLLIIGGFDGMEGAAMLAASAAFETGIGLVTLLTTGAARPLIAGKIPELMTMALPEGLEEAAEAVRSLLGARRWNAILIGPGLGRSEYSRVVAETVFAAAAGCGTGRILVDGDGLFHLGDYVKKERLDAAVEWIITPHFLEASRISGMSVDDIKKNRYGSAGMISHELSCAVLLKGPATIVAGGGRRYVNTTGCAALGTAGSGDVLSGIIGSLLMRRMPAVHAAACGAWIHGRAAELHCSENNTDILRSSDIISFVRAAKQQM
ncbi:MAG: NAD(P)H-hydrate dehydratase [Spirochaetes bacterium]|nr:NAD(P)H-hydrate dehydratase [Spirochaetota bacterium]